MEMDAEDDLDRAISMLRDCFSYNDLNQGSFGRALRKVWAENEFTSFDRENSGVIHARERMDKLARKDSGLEFSEIIVISKDRIELLRLVMTRRDFHTLIRVIIRRSGWPYEVYKMEHVPSGLRDAIHRAGIAISSIFPKLKDPCDDACTRYPTLCGPRFIYSLKRSGSLMFETDEDECDYASSKSESEAEESEEHEMVEVTSEVEVLLKEKEEVTLMRIADNATLRCEEEKMSSVHPYQLSCAIFTMCSRHETKEWSASRIYSYVRDFLCDQVRLTRGEGEDRIKRIGSEILGHLSGIRECEELKSYLMAFEGVAPLVHKHRRKFTDDRLMMRRGRLEGFERLSQSQLEELARDRFHPFHSPTRGRPASMFHCPCGTQDCSPAFLRFQRDRVSPLQLHTSLCMLERKFRRTEERPWSVIFSDDTVILITDDRFLGEMLRDHVPYLLNRDKLIHRTVLVPSYYVHVHNYFFGSPLGLCTSMEFLLRSFSWMRFSKSAYMPKTTEDPVIQSYRLLHIIMDKFGSEDSIRNHLKQPLSGLVHDKKRKASALREDLPTIYSSLRAFVLVYAPHSITKTMVYRLRDMFTHDETMNLMRAKHRLAWKLIKELAKRSEVTDDDEIMIPENLMNYRPSDTDQSPEDVFDHPSHLLLYYLCASGDLEASEAVSLFLSIGSYTRVSGQMKVARYCSSISMRKPNPRSKVALASSGMIAYEVLKAKDSVPKDSEDVRFAHGITHLFRLLEDMEYPQEETIVPLTPEQILSDRRSPIGIPLDLRDPDHPRAGACLPIWKSLIYDSSYRTTDIICSSENTGRSMVYSGEMEMRPFWGCHRDMLECIILQPISRAQALPMVSDSDLLMTSGAPLDLRDTGSPSPSTPDGSPLSARIDKLSERFHRSYEDRGGWSYPPSMFHVLSEALPRHERELSDI